MFTRINVSQAAALVENSQALVVDIRDANAFASGHIEGATRVDNSNFQEYLSQADKTKPIIVVCYHGNSSQSAAELFNQQGFIKSYSLDGGMSGWSLTNEVVTE